MERLASKTVAEVWRQQLDLNVFQHQTFRVSLFFRARVNVAPSQMRRKKEQQQKANQRMNSKLLTNLLTGRREHHTVDFCRRA
jgi:hypothetical protein